MLQRLIKRGALLAILLGAVVVPAAALAQDDDMLEAEVRMSGFAFEPDTVFIPVGFSIKWTNHDSAQHTATSPTFDTGPLGQGESASVHFATAGQFSYACAIHPQMIGNVVVQSF
jgi:plastocyanin